MRFLWQGASVVLGGGENMLHYKTKMKILWQLGDIVLEIKVTSTTHLVDTCVVSCRK